jgi:hypothetical protein
MVGTASSKTEDLEMRKSMLDEFADTIVVNATEKSIRAKLRKQFGRHYRDRFEIRTCASNRAISVHWKGGPDETVIEAIGRPFVTGTDSDGIWFFQTHHNE